MPVFILKKKYSEKKKPSTFGGYIDILLNGLYIRLNQA